MLLFLIILFLLILTVYIFYRLGLLNVLQIFFLGLLCILSMIIIYLLLCPTTIKNYIFFQGNLHTVLTNVPNEIIDQTRINALSEVNNPNTGQILSNLTNQLIDIVAQKPVDNHSELNAQMRLLSDIKNELSTINSNTEKANILTETQLAQYQEGQSLALKKLSTIDNSLNTQTKELKIVINNPTGVLDKLTSINSHVKPNLAILGELHNLNYTIGQEKQILSEGFNKMLQAEGNNTLANDIQNLSKQLSNKFDVYQANTERLLQTMQNEIASERLENKKLLEQVQMSSLADIEIAREDAEQRIAAAEQMVNNYRKHESLGTHSYKSGIDLSKVDSNGVNQAAAGVGLVSALTWALKFLRIV